MTYHTQGDILPSHSARLRIHVQHRKADTVAAWVEREETNTMGVSTGTHRMDMVASSNVAIATRPCS